MSYVNQLKGQCTALAGSSVYPLLAVAICKSLSRSSVLLFHNDNEKACVSLPAGSAPVTALNFSHSTSSTVRLCASSINTVRVWQVDHWVTEDNEENISQSSFNILYTFSMDPRSICFDRTASIVAVAHGNRVTLFAIEAQEQLCDLITDHGMTTACAFVTQPELDHYLLSCGHDRILRLWDLRTQKVGHESGIICAAPLMSLCVCLSADEEDILITAGSLDGTLFLFTLCETRLGTKLEQLRKICVPPLIQKKITSSIHPNNSISTSALPSIETPIVSISPVQLQTSNYISEVTDVDMPIWLQSDESSASISKSQTTEEILILQLPQYVVLLPRRTLQLERYCAVLPCDRAVDTPELIAYGTVCAGTSQEPLFAFAPMQSTELIRLTESNLSWTSFRNNELTSMTEATTNTDATSIKSSDWREALLISKTDSKEPNLSETKLPTGPRTTSIDLFGHPVTNNYAPLQPVTWKSRKGEYKQTSTSSAKGMTSRRPLKNVRSSGYGGVAPRKLFGQDRTNARSRKTTKQPESHPVLHQYPLGASPPNTSDSRLDSLMGIEPLHERGIRRIEWSYSGNTLLSCGWDGVCTISRISKQLLQSDTGIKKPINSGPRSSHTTKQSTHTDSSNLNTNIKMNAVKAFDGTCNDISWSFLDYDIAGIHRLKQKSGAPGAIRPVRPSTNTAGPVYLASHHSAVKLYGAGQESPLLVFQENAFMGSRKNAKEVSRDTNSTNIIAAQFVYQDKIICSAKGGTLYLFQFTLSPNDLEEGKTGRFKRVGQIQVASEGSSITCISTINSPRSSMVFAGTSSRQISCIDIASTKVVQTWEEAHTRAPHAIAQPSASHSCGLDASAYHMLVSAAPAASAASSDGANLWDLRSLRQAGSFTGHIHRSSHLACNIAFSPDAAYVAAGSEDKMAYIYDIRKPTYLHRLRGADDAVIDVSFHPCISRIATGSLDGKVRHYLSR